MTTLLQHCKLFNTGLQTKMRPFVLNLKRSEDCHSHTRNQSRQQSLHPRVTQGIRVGQGKIQDIGLDEGLDLGQGIVEMQETMVGRDRVKPSDTNARLLSRQAPPTSHGKYPNPKSFIKSVTSNMLHVLIIPNGDHTLNH